MGAARARLDLLHDGQVGLLLQLALDDQVAAPRLEPEGPLDRGVLVVDAQGEDEVGLGLPGDLELDDGAGGQPEVAADRRALAVGRRLARIPRASCSARPARASRSGRWARDRSGRHRRAIGRSGGGSGAGRAPGPGGGCSARPCRSSRPTSDPNSTSPAASSKQKSPAGRAIVAGGGHWTLLTSLTANSNGATNAAACQRRTPGRLGVAELARGVSAVGQVQDRRLWRRVRGPRRGAAQCQQTRERPTPRGGAGSRASRANGGLHRDCPYRWRIAVRASVAVGSCISRSSPGAGRGRGQQVDRGEGASAGRRRTSPRGGTRPASGGAPQRRTAANSCAITRHWRSSKIGRISRFGDPRRLVHHDHIIGCLELLGRDGPLEQERSRAGGADHPSGRGCGRAGRPSIGRRRGGGTRGGRRSSFAMAAR